MPNVQHSLSCKVYLHPMTCKSPVLVAAFQLRTGLRIIATASGNAQAIPVIGGAA